MKFKIVLLICFVVVGLQTANSLIAKDWKLFEETSIRSRISGSIEKRHIFQTVSGKIYKVIDYVYLYEYNSEVIVLNNRQLYKLVIEGFDKPLFCKRLNEETSASSEKNNIDLI